MVFKTAIKNNLGYERRLMWLKGGLTIDPFGFQLMEGCWPDKCNDSERRGFLNELEGGSITVTYVTDMATIHPDKLQEFLETSGKNPNPPVEAPVAPVAPVAVAEESKEVIQAPAPVKEKVDVKSDPIPQAIRKLQEDARKLFAEANKNPDTKAFKFGEADVDAPRGKEVDLTSKLAHEGSMEQFMSQRKGFTPDDVTAVAELPEQTPAFKEMEFKPTVDKTPMFSETSAPANQPAETPAKLAEANPVVEAQTIVAAASKQSQRGRKKGG